MKAIKKSSTEPSALAKYNADYPLNDWDKFRKQSKRYKQVALALRKDQRGICAYCEIDLLKSVSGNGKDDFRVEHFHPKTPHSPPPNWAIDWKNLLACCHGGAERDVKAKGRFTAPDLSCDALKGSKNLVGNILDPLKDILPESIIFKYEKKSEECVEIKLSPECPAHLVAKAKASLIELGLNTVRLSRLRAGVLRAIEEAFLAEDQDDDVGRTMELLAKAFFSEDERQSWPPFFSLARWYLSAAAEKRLKEIGYMP